MSRKRQEKQAKLAKRIKVVAFKDACQFRGALFDPTMNDGISDPYVWKAPETHPEISAALLDARTEYVRRSRTTVRKRKLIAR